MAIEIYTPSQIRASEVLANERAVFLTGKPGTGKTAFLNDYCIRQKENGKRIRLTASTGMAASALVDAQTIHHMLGWNPRKHSYDYKTCGKELNHIDILVVDEVSMLNREILNHIYKCIMAQDNKPQIIFSGDFFQLPPVHCGQYPFETDTWNLFQLYPCVLDEVVRQTDREFLEQLDKARCGDPTCISYFNNYTAREYIDGAIMLCTTNECADKYNASQYEKLKGKSYTYYARGDVDKAQYENTRVERVLELKEGMRVMAIRNDPDGYYQNGSLGTIADLSRDWIGVIFDNGTYDKVTRVKFDLDRKKETGETVEIQQFPLRGGYAITVHKSQGQTFDAININADRFWENGQLYVAVSRAKTIEGIHLMHRLKYSDLHTSDEVLNFYCEIQRIRMAV